MAIVVPLFVGHFTPAQEHLAWRIPPPRERNESRNIMTPSTSKSTLPNSLQKEDRKSARLIYLPPHPLVIHTRFRARRAKRKNTLKMLRHASRRLIQRSAARCELAGGRRGEFGRGWGRNCNAHFDEPPEGVFCLIQTRRKVPEIIPTCALTAPKMIRPN